MSRRCHAPRVALAIALALPLAAPTASGRANADVPSLESEDAAYSVFLLVKATPAWLALAPDERFGWLDDTIAPILADHPEVSMRFWDVEHFSARSSDVILFETARLDHYLSVIERLRETRFWDDYFLVQEILPGVENAYAQAYDRPAY